MARRLHAIDATSSPRPQRLDGVEAHEGLRNSSQDSRSHRLISTQARAEDDGVDRPAQRARRPADGPVREAAAQLAWKYGHVKQAKTGLLDAFFAAYAPYEDKGMAFFDWVDNVYDPDEVASNFQAKGWAVRLTDSILHRE